MRGAGRSWSGCHSLGQSGRRARGAVSNRAGARQDDLFSQSLFPVLCVRPAPPPARSVACESVFCGHLLAWPSFSVDGRIAVAIWTTLPIRNANLLPFTHGLAGGVAPHRASADRASQQRFERTACRAARMRACPARDRCCLRFKTSMGTFDRAGPPRCGQMRRVEYRCLVFVSSVGGLHA